MRHVGGGDTFTSPADTNQVGARPMIDGLQMGNLREKAGATGVFTSAVATFVVSGVVATAALALGGVVLIQRTGHSEAIRDAKELSQFAGEGIVAPVLSDGVLHGNTADIDRLAPKAAHTILRARSEEHATALSAREKEVLACLVDGLQNKQIARRLGISEKTVKTHLTNIFSQIGVTDRTQAALWAVRNGFTT